VDEQKKILIQLFMKGEEIKSEKKSAALMLAHLMSIAPETPSGYRNSPPACAQSHAC
jgi:hypothetical protein